MKALNTGGFLSLSVDHQWQHLSGCCAGHPARAGHSVAAGASLARVSGFPLASSAVDVSGLGTDQLQHKAGSTCVSHATSGWWKRYHATTIKQLCRDAEYYSHTCLLLVTSCSKLTLAVSVFCRVPALYSQMNRDVCVNIPLHIFLYAKTYLMLLDGTCTAAKVLAQCNLEIQGSSAWWWSGFWRF